jgi:hypothetical protein
MRILSLFSILPFILVSAFNVQAANEWKNPDLAAPPQKKKVVPVPPARTTPPPPVAAPAPAPVSAPALEGQLSLDSLRVCNYQLSYVDKGSGGKIDGAFYLPTIPHGYYMIGAYAQGNYDEPTDCILAVKPANPQSASLLQAPRDWQRLWTDKGSGANMDGSFWHPSAQSSDYVCLGSIAQKGYSNPILNNYRCVHRCLVESIPSASRIWSTKGTGANQTAYVYKLHNSNSFYVIPGTNRPAELQDIKGPLACGF